MARTIRPTWTDAENSILTAHYATADFSELVQLLPRRNEQGIRMQASRLELDRPRTYPGGWTEEHMAILRTHYPTEGAAYVAALVGRSVNRVTGHASAHGVAFVGKPKQPKPKPAPKKRGRPAKALVVGPLPAVVAHDTRPKASNKLRPLDTRVPTTAPTPAKGSPKTPNLNARVAARVRAAQVQADKPKPFIVAADFHGLDANHPARWAYTRAAHKGPAAATAAFHEAMKHAA